MSQTLTPRIVCAISGVTLNEDDESVLETLEFTDGAAELPVGWTRITVENRVLNPSYEAIQFVKAGLITQMLAQLPPHMQEDAEEAITIQYDAQFAALEAQPGNVPTLLNKVEVYLAPVDRVPGLEGEVERLFSSLGVALENDDDDDDDAEDDGEEGAGDSDVGAHDPDAGASDADQTQAQDDGKVHTLSRRRRRRSKPSDTTSDP